MEIWSRDPDTRQVAKEEKVVDILVNNAGLVTWKRELTEDGQCGDTMSPV